MSSGLPPPCFERLAHRSGFVVVFAAVVARNDDFADLSRMVQLRRRFDAVVEIEIRPVFSARRSPEQQSDLARFNRIDILPRRSGTPRTGTLDRPIIGQTLLLVWKKAVRESGFTKPINVHTLRHCYGTHLLEEGASVRSVQDNLGHRSGRTTSTYVHQTAKRTRQSADAIERIAQNLPR